VWFSSVLKPVDYLLVRQRVKRRVDWSSLLLGGACGLALSFVPSFNVIYSNGLVAGVNGLFQALPGFYVAALAAIAVFDGAKRGYDLDEPWRYEPAYIIDQGEEDRLSRRRFLSLLFGYLALSSFGIYFLGLIVSLVGPALRNWTYLPVVRAGFMCIYSAWIAHVVATTCFGLYFLSHRMHVTSNSN